MSSRREFISKSGAALISIPLIGNLEGIDEPNGIIKPKRLSKGDRIGVIAPGGAVFTDKYVKLFSQVLTNLGFKVTYGKTIELKWGQFAGKDEERADDLHSMFENDEINAIFTMRGGSGCSRLIPYLDFDLIKSNPKILMGFSDITTLINAIYTKTGLVGFHGPVGYSTWNNFSVSHFRSTVMNGALDLMSSRDNNDDYLLLYPGKVKGKLIGGNLTTIIHLLGTGFMPNPEGKILFLEEVDEEPYRVDRMLMHLKLSGYLDKLEGLVFGQFKRCNPEEPEKSHSLKEVLRDYISPLKKPSFYGAHFGHVRDKFTLPIGIEAELNSTLGTIQLLESSVL